MELFFENWKIRVQEEPIPQQYDNLSCALSVNGDLPVGWSWQALIAQGENLDIIALSRTDRGAAAELTAQNLALAGPYSIQIRGTKGSQVRHTNLIRVYIPGSLSGEAVWPTLPTAFSQVERRIREMGNHPPVPGDTGYWMLWEADQGKYVQSEALVPTARDGAQGPKGERGEKGENGRTPYIAANGNWYIGDTDTGVGAEGKNGTDGVTPHIGDNGNWWFDTQDTGLPSRGEKGDPGAEGARGPRGEPGITPQRGEDYWTREDQEEMVAQVLEALPDGTEVRY